MWRACWAFRQVIVSKRDMAIHRAIHVWVLLALLGCGSEKSGASTASGGNAGLGSGGGASTATGAPTFAGSDGIQYNGALRWERRL